MFSFTRLLRPRLNCLYRHSKSPIAAMAREIKSQTTTTETVVKRTTEETQEQVKVKKTKKEEVTVKKKKSGWEPFDPSLPNNMTFPTSFNFPKKPENTITFASYNVASLPASIKKGFNKYVDAEDADILCVQETKVNKPLDTAVSKEIYPHQYWTFSSKKGYGKLYHSSSYSARARLIFQNKRVSLSFQSSSQRK